MQKSTLSGASRISLFGGQETVWSEFTPLAAKYQACNLGQGFPDWPTPDFIKNFMIQSVNENMNQYCRSQGHPPLVKLLAQQYSQKFNQEINWETQLSIGVGASQVLYSIMQSHINPGDEVILLSPAFDIYSAQITMAGGVAKYVPLRISEDQKNWYLDMNELRKAFTDKTKFLLLNTPHNPTGKVFTKEEFQQIADIITEFPNANVITDEVYEHMVFDGLEHNFFANTKNMWDRTITVSSAGKTFSVTGWKVGWAVGPPQLIKPLQTTNQFLQFCTSTPAQQALAYSLEEAQKPYKGFNNYYEWLNQEYLRKREILSQGLLKAGLSPMNVQGGFFMIADTSTVNIPQEYLEETTNAAPVMKRDWALCRMMAKEMQVVGIPPSAFYEDKDKDLAANIVRFAFCKEDDMLRQASNNLLNLKKYM